MGDFGRALKREVGKNTGKFISNVVFGDKHSTPYRRIEPSYRLREREARSKERAREQSLRQQRIEETVRANDIKEKEVKARIREVEKQRLYALDGAVISSIDKLLSYPIPSDIYDLENYVQNLAIQIQATNDEGNGEEAKIRRKFNIALQERFNQALNSLERKYPESEILPDYIELSEKIAFEKYSRDKQPSKMLQLNWILSRSIPSDERRLQKEFEILRYYTSQYIWPPQEAFKQNARYANERYKRVRERLESIAPDNTVLQSVITEELQSRKVAKRKIKMTLGISAVIVYLLCCCFLGAQFVVCSMFVLVCMGGFVFWWKLRKKKAVNGDQSSRTIESQLSADRIQVPENNDVVFFDLNEDNRIGSSLKSIWAKHCGIVPDTILSRKPIFAAEGIEKSLLFVGINPSYNPTDDTNLILSEDGTSLLYGSFYKRKDSPEYFASLESFARRFQLPYTQLNLLYARENNREELLQSDSGFIREQLELTYETIVKLKPKAIVFMSDWCRCLIGGKDRWVDLDEASPGHRVLNGTDIPAFFSDDIFVLTEEEKNMLERKIKTCLMP